MSTARMATRGALAALLLLAPAAGCSVAPEGARTLAFGDPAPALRIDEWLKGEPVGKFEKGRIYIVEMWATWCGPCLGAIPHMQRIAQRYRADGVVVIAINVMDPDAAAVRAFVAAAGARMGHRVARDAAVPGEEAGVMAQAWLPAKRTIPCCFIVDRDARVAWSGHPLRVEAPLQAILAGKYDTAKQAEIEREWNELGERYSRALQSKQWSEAASLLDQMDVVDPSTRALLIRQRIAVELGRGDAAAAERIARDTLAGPHDPRLASEVVVALLAASEPSRLDLDFILAEAKKAADDGRSDDPLVLGALARAYVAKGAMADAVGVWRRMIEACGPLVNREGIEGLIKDAEARLADRRAVTTDPGR